MWNSTRIKIRRETWGKTLKIPCLISILWDCYSEDPKIEKVVVRCYFSTIKKAYNIYFYCLANPKNFHCLMALSNHTQLQHSARMSLQAIVVSSLDFNILLASTSLWKDVEHIKKERFYFLIGDVCFLSILMLTKGQGNLRKRREKISTTDCYGSEHSKLPVYPESHFVQNFHCLIF